MKKENMIHIIKADEYTINMQVTHPTVTGREGTKQLPPDITLLIEDVEPETLADGTMIISLSFDEAREMVKKLTTMIEFDPTPKPTTN